MDRRPFAENLFTEESLIASTDAEGRSIISNQVELFKSQLARPRKSDESVRFSSATLLLQLALLSFKSAPFSRRDFRNCRLKIIDLKAELANLSVCRLDASSLREHEAFEF